MHKFDRHSYQKERFIQSFEREQRSKIEYQQKLEEERRMREQQDKDFQESLIKDQLREIESIKFHQPEPEPEPIVPLTKEELRLARIAFFTENNQS